MQVWTTFLDPHSVPAVRYAFDNWNRNGRFFPKPKDILEQIEAYNLSKGPKGLPPGCPNCEEGWIRVFKGATAGGNQIDPKVGAMRRCECFYDRSLRRPAFEHHRQGYNARDISYLWKLYQAMQARVNGRILTKAEVNSLLDVLDKKRGVAPAWRKAS